MMHTPQTAALLPLEGTFNCRDIGGYRAAGGKTVVRGRLLRADALYKLTDGDLALLQEMGIRVVVDFRAPSEAEAQPDRIPDGAVLLNLTPHAALAAMASTDRGDAVRLKKLEGMAATEEGRAWLARHTGSMGEQMRKLVTDPHAVSAYSRFMHLLADPETGPLIFHCKGGKDRTGWAAALILLALGVSRADVMEDYMATGLHNRARNERRMGEYRALTSHPTVLEFLSSLMQVEEGYLEAALEELDGMGGIDRYLSDTLGLTPDERESLRVKYLV